MKWQRIYRCWSCGAGPLPNPELLDCPDCQAMLDEAFDHRSTVKAFEKRIDSVIRPAPRIVRRDECLCPKLLGPHKHDPIAEFGQLVDNWNARRSLAR